MDIPFKVKSEFDTSQNQSGLKKKRKKEIISPFHICLVQTRTRSPGFPQFPGFCRLYVDLGSEWCERCEWLFVRLGVCVSVCEPVMDWRS